ncbi:MAG: alpha/beta hydrolase, partial [Hyphomicrobiales bacterium]|nr:alpha/beta hydrolase [Hyphomicrobiales bacterium]
YDHLRATGVKPEDIAIYGESIGSAVAVQLAAAQPVGAVVLEAPFTSAVDVAASVYWFLPVRLLMRDRFDSISRIGNIQAPLLVLHGRHDVIVPHSFGERLYVAAKEPKFMISVENAGHETVLRQSALASVVEFIGKTTYSP